MLERIENVDRFRPRRRRIMAGPSSGSSGYEIDRKLIQEMDLGGLINGFIQTMRRKYRQFPLENVVHLLDQLVKELEYDFKVTFDVESVDYDDTDSESSSETPPPVQRRRYEQKRAAPELYINRLEKRIRKFIFAQDEEHGQLFTNDLQRKLCVHRFISKSGLSESDIQQFLSQRSNT